MDDYSYSFNKDLDPEEFRNAMRRFRDEGRGEAMKKHPAGKTTKTATKNRLSDEASTYLGLTIFKFFFITIPLVALFAGLAVQPLFEVAWGIDLGFWTALFVLSALRWLIPRPSKKVPLEKIYAKESR